MLRALFVSIGLAFITSALANPEPVEFGSVNVKMGDQNYQLEHAFTFDQRVRGLMYRKQLCDVCGMLFTFDPPKVGSIWMKNTYVPLDLAYVDAEGVITDIAQLKPLDLTSVRSSRTVAYAIEMNQGFFATHGIKVGDRIEISSTPVE